MLTANGHFNRPLSANLISRLINDIVAGDLIRELDVGGCCSIDYTPNK